MDLIKKNSFRGCDDRHRIFSVVIAVIRFSIYVGQVCLALGCMTEFYGPAYPLLRVYAITADFYCLICFPHF